MRSPPCVLRKQSDQGSFHRTESSAHTPNGLKVHMGKPRLLSAWQRKSKIPEASRIRRVFLSPGLSAVWAPQILLETKRPTVHFGTPWASGTCADGGGGGSRTPVREHSTQSVYRFRSGTDFTTLLAPDRAQGSNPAGTDLVETPGRRQAPPA